MRGSIATGSETSAVAVVRICVFLLGNDLQPVGGELAAWADEVGAHSGLYRGGHSASAGTRSMELFPSWNNSNYSYKEAVGMKIQLFRISVGIETPRS